MTLRALHDVPAPAKLNLFLHVIGRRADGYHRLQSVFVLIDWADRLHFERRDDGCVVRHDVRHERSGVRPRDPLPAEDLCVRAARALAAASGSSLGVDIHLDKRVPTGAGMGGGSSDAATTLLALNRLWNLRWPRERLAAVGFTLGADVPFFVHGHNAFVEGIGEKITPLPVPEQRYAVVKPAASLGTAEVFGHPALRRNTVPIGEPTNHPGILAGYSGGFGRNDLQPVAEERCPEVAEVAHWLAQRFGNSRMTGSGSAVFARAQASQALPAALPAGWVGRMCTGLARHPLAEWASGAE